MNLSCFLVVTSVVQHKHEVDGMELTVKRYADEDIKAEVIVPGLPPRTSHFTYFYL